MRCLILGFVLLAGCGIPVDSGPEPVDIEAATDPDDQGPVLGDLSSVPIYLVRDDNLVPVTRDLPSPSTPQLVLESLLGRVTEPEQRAALRTAIPGDTRLLDVTSEGAVLSIDLSREFASVGGDEEILAVAQIVLTATSIEAVDLVTFLLEGIPTDVPVAGGALSDDPVDASDYESRIVP